MTVWRQIIISIPQWGKRGIVGKKTRSDFFPIPSTYIPKDQSHFKIKQLYIALLSNQTANDIIKS